MNKVNQFVIRMALILLLTTWAEAKSTERSDLPAVQEKINQTIKSLLDITPTLRSLSEKEAEFKN